MTAINPRKLTDNYKDHPNIFLYKTTSNDSRWIVKHTFAKDTDQLFKILRTIFLGSNHDHPALLPVKKFYINPSSQKGFEVYQKLPRMTQNLGEFLNAAKSGGGIIPEAKILKYLYTLLSGVEYLHKKKIPHANIKPSNILINNSGDIKITDIGFQQFPSDPSCLAVESQELSLYTAPELITQSSDEINKRLLYQGDMWSIGVIIAELCFTETLKDKNQVQRKLSQLEGTYSQGIIELLTSLTNIDPQERMTPREALEFLREKYPSLIQKLEEDFVINRIDIIKREIEEKHREIIEFDQKKPFAIQALTGTGITENSLEALVQDLRRKLQQEQETANLQHFEFNAAGSRYITNLAVRNLTTYIGYHLQNLTHLKLDFPYCEQLGDQAVHEICHIASNVKYLEDLSISFPWCKKITDQSLDKLTYHIGYNFKELKALYLDFRNCPKITSKALETLSNNFKDRLLKLQTLNLRFSGCELIDDEGIKSLHQLIGLSLPKLKNLSISLAGCSKISLRAIKELCTHINLKSIDLQDLLLDFEGCKLLVNELSLKEIQNLKLELGFLKKTELIFV